jgi:hypothetical protein
VVKCVGDHVCLLDDLPNDATLTQKIVVSSVFPVTKILVIEDHKLNSTKQALIPIERPEKATRGGVNESQSKFLDGTRPIS